MTLKRVLLVATLVIAAIIAVFGFLRSAPAQVPFGKVLREDLVSTLITNGQVRPVKMAEVRTEASGRIAQIYVEQGESVSSGQTLLRLEGGAAATGVLEAKAAVDSAQARVSQLSAGGVPQTQARLQADLREARLRLAASQREAEGLRRLVERKAATPEELRRQEEIVAQNSAAVEAAERALDLLISPAEMADASAALVRAKATLDEAQRIAGLQLVESPISGALFELSAKLGGWLSPEDLVGRVGDLGRVIVAVYVDEPELGRVKKGLPVKIRWDAFPDRTWNGAVDTLPTRIQAFGTRQVGEVLCLIDNPGHDLLPGTNVNVEIVTATARGTLVIPKQALRRRLGQDGVWTLDDDRIRWQTVELGVSSLTSVEVLKGLSEGASVALVYDRELSEGLNVSPVYP